MCVHVSSAELVSEPLGEAQAMFYSSVNPPLSHVLGTWTLFTEEAHLSLFYGF